MQKTESGNYVIFQAEEAGQPQYFEPGKFYYEPVNYQDNEVFSDPYDTAEAAVEAAEIWEEVFAWAVGAEKEEVL